MQLVDWLDDLCVRFIINLPHEELESVARICFQVEEAQWFYEDFIRPTDPSLPSLHLKDFCLAIFSHCPLLSSFSGSQHLAAYQEFLGYKTRVPVRGAILLNQDMDQVLLVKGWKKGSSWSFPRGKINKDEKDLDCAIREVYEETGYDINAAGLAADSDAVKAIDVTMREQHIRLFCFRGVAQTTEFAPRTRKEISKIEWYNLTDLPTFKKGKTSAEGNGQDLVSANLVSASKFYMVAPFLGPLKKWIKQQHKLDAQQAKYGDLGEITEDGIPTEPVREEPPFPQIQVASLADETMQLKQLLNIGGPASHPPLPVPALMPVPHQQNEQTHRLVSLLRGHTTPSAEPQHNTLPSARTSAPEDPGNPTRISQQLPAALHQPPTSFPMNSPHQNYMAPMPMYAMQQPHPMQHWNATPAHVTGLAPPPFRQQDPSLQQQPVNSQEHRIPEASQLPAPNLNSHAMGLLNAFKIQTPALDTRNAQPSQTSSMYTSHVSPPAARTPHQTSLLDLFRRPSLPQDQATTTQSASQAPRPQPSAAPSVVTNYEKPPTRPAEHARRKSSAVSMITRTLPPKQSIQSTTPPVPRIHAAYMNSTVSNNKTAGFRDVKQNSQAGTRSHAHPQPQVTILQRPTSSTTADLVASIPALGAQHDMSRSVMAEKQQDAPSQPVKQISSRPTSTSYSTDETKLKKKMRTVTETKPQQQQPFQPQVLRRPDSTERQAAALGMTATLNRDLKRDALLALFASSSAAEPSSPDAGATDHYRSRNASLEHSPIGGPKNNPVSINTAQKGSPASALLGILSAQRASLSNSTSGSRVDSPSSTISRGGIPQPISISRKLSEGLRSPESPAEAKDFLLDFLKGVK